jgi:hypothetical protein
VRCRLKDSVLLLLFGGKKVGMMATVLMDMRMNVGTVIVYGLLHGVKR